MGTRERQRLIRPVDAAAVPVRNNMVRPISLGDSTAEKILGMQKTLGNQAVQHMASTYLVQVQPKLTIGQPGDKYEQEADQVAKQVMRMSDIQRSPGCVSCGEREETEPIQTKPLSEQITPLVQRQTEPEEEEEEPIQAKPEDYTRLQRQAEEEEEEEEPIQTKRAGGQTPLISPSLQSRINSLKGGGQPLPESTRKYFEPKFGSSFAQVRVHNNSQAANIAKSINAKAFTTGRDVVFGAGQYSPETSGGKRLLAHELTHVVQQHHYSGKTPLNFRRSRKSPFKAQKRNAKIKQSKDNEIIHNNLIQPMSIAEHITPVVQRLGEKPPKSAIRGEHQAWEVDTTCLFFGIRPDKNNRNCYDYWPPHVDEYARKRGADGAASCREDISKITKRKHFGAKHLGRGLHDVPWVRVWYRDKMTAQWSYVTVWCADPTPNLVELSPHAAKKLFGSLSKAPGATVRVEILPFGGALYYNYRQAPILPFGPTLRDCLSKGCFQKPIAGRVGKRISDEASPWAEIPWHHGLITRKDAMKWRKAIKRHRALWVSRIQKRIRTQLKPSQRVKIEGHFAKREFTTAMKLYQKAKGLQETGIVDTPTSQVLGFHYPVPWWVSGKQPTTVTPHTARAREQMWREEVRKRIKRTVSEWARNKSQQHKNEMMRAAGLEGTDPVQWIADVKLSIEERRAEALKLYQAIVSPGSITGKLDRKTCVKLGIPELPYYIFPK